MVTGVTFIWARWTDNFVIIVIGVGWAFTFWGTSSVSGTGHTGFVSGTGFTPWMTFITLSGLSFIVSGDTVTFRGFSSVFSTFNTLAFSSGFTFGTFRTTVVFSYFVETDRRYKVFSIQVFEVIGSVGSITEGDLPFFQLTRELIVELIFTHVDSHEFSVEVSSGQGEFFFFILEFNEERNLVILVRVTSIDEEPFVSFFSRSSYFRHGFLE